MPAKSDPAGCPSCGGALELVQLTRSPIARPAGTPTFVLCCSTPEKHNTSAQALAEAAARPLPAETALA